MLWSAGTGKCNTMNSLLFIHLFIYYYLALSLVFWLGLETVCISKSQIIIYFFSCFSHQRWSLIDIKFPQVSRTLLSILANLNNAIVWMVSTHPLISKFSSPLLVSTHPLISKFSTHPLISKFSTHPLISKFSSPLLVSTHPLISKFSTHPLISKFSTHPLISKFSSPLLVSTHPLISKFSTHPLISKFSSPLLVSTHPLISKFSCPLLTIPRAPIIIGINVTFMFNRSGYLSFFSFSFNFTLWSAGKAKSIIC